MAERRTLLARNTQAPTVSPTQSGANPNVPSGAFGDYRGLIAAGQAAQDVAQTGIQIAARAKSRQEQLREEMDRRTMQDYRMKADNEYAVAALGVKKEYEERTAAGEFTHGGSYRWVEDSLNKARAAASERLGGISSEPLFKTAVPESHIELSWTRQVDNILTSAAHHEGQAKMQGRIDDADTMVGASFGASAPGDHTSITTELGEKTGQLNALAIPRNAKNQLSRQLADRAYDRVVHGLTMGHLIPDAVLKNNLFSPGQQQMLYSLNEKAKKPAELFQNAGEATKVLDATVADPAFANDPAKMQTAQEAADYIASKAESPEAKGYAYAQVRLKAAEHDIVRNNFEKFAAAPGDQKLYQRLTSFSTLLSDEKTSSAFYDSLGIKGAAPEDRSRFLTSLKAKATATLDLINTGRANEVADSSDALAPIAGIATAEFASDRPIHPDVAQRYVVVSRAEQTRMGIPEHLQVHVPSGVTKIVVDRIWNGDTNNGSRMITQVGESFGSQALDSLSRSFLAPSNVPKDVSSLDSTTARSRSYAALMKIAASDHARVESGARSLELHPFLKQWMDDLANYEKNASTFPRSSGLVAQKAFNLSSFKDPVNQQELLSLDQIGTITSQVQSLPGIAKALFWQSGQNNNLSAGFQEMMTRIIQAKAYSTGVTSGEDKESREFLAVRATDDLNNALARVYTVVNVGGAESTRQILDAWPTKISGEGALEFPKSFGAADTVDLGKQLADGLKYVGYYDPKDTWDRGTASNIINWFSRSYRNTRATGLMYSTGSAAILEVPSHLQVKWSDIIGIVPEQYTSGGADVIKDYLEKPITRHTINSVAFAQNGAWRMNWKTGEVEAMIFPGRANSPASPSIQNPGPAQPLTYTNGTPVTKKADEIRQFVDAYRLLRIDPGAGQPTSRELERMSPAERSKYENDRQAWGANRVLNSMKK